MYYLGVLKMIDLSSNMQEGDALKHTHAKFHVFTPIVNWSGYTMQPRD